jgi:hypothetical protein
MSIGASALKTHGCSNLNNRPFDCSSVPRPLAKRLCGWMSLNPTSQLSCGKSMSKAPSVFQSERIEAQLQLCFTFATLAISESAVGDLESAERAVANAENIYSIVSSEIANPKRTKSLTSRQFQLFTTELRRVRQKLDELRPIRNGLVSVSPETYSRSMVEASICCMNRCQSERAGDFIAEPLFPNAPELQEKTTYQKVLFSPKVFESNASLGREEWARYRDVRHRITERLIGSTALT